MRNHAWLRTRQYLDIAAKLDKNIPLYNVSGNHDEGNEPTPETMAYYRKHYGKPWYSFVHKNSLFIILDTNLIVAGAKVKDAAEKHMAWFKQTLAAADDKGYDHRLVFMHHPVCLKSVDEDDLGWGIPKPTRGEFLALLHKHNVTATFSGHYHRNAYVKDGDLELITSSSSGKPLGSDPPGFRIVKVFPERIEHTYYKYEDLPEKVTLKTPQKATE